MENKNIELMTSTFDVVETADDVIAKPKRAIIKMKLINEGMNSKHLMWIPATMRKVAHMFRGVPFRYDLNGTNEGSHTKDRLSSPFYDVGWTYSDDRGAYYDEKEHAIVVQGEVTHPDIIERLSRVTSDGKREINFASMGALIRPEDTQCSVCFKKPFGTCSHQRGDTYNGSICAMIPLNVQKGLHVALTNDPADRIAEIAEAIFQDMNEMADNAAENSPVSPALNIPVPSDLHETIRTIVQEILEQKTKAKMEAQEDSEEDDSMDEDKKKKKKSEEKVIEKKEVEVEKETQKGSQDEKLNESSLKETAEEEKEDSEKKKKDLKEDKKDIAEDTKDLKEDKKDLKEDKKELADEDLKEKDDEDDEEEKEDDEEEKEDDEETKNKKKDLKEKKEMADAAIDNLEIEIKGVAKQIPQLHVQDTSIQSTKPVLMETADSVYEKKYRAKVLRELADAYVQFNKADSVESAMKILEGKSTAQLEIFQEAFEGIVVQKPVAQKPILQPTQTRTHIANKHFADDVPEFGGTQEQQDPILEIQDMSPEDRRKTFGAYGSFDVLFNPGNAHRYSKKH